MASRSIFIIGLICIGATFHTVDSAVRHRMSERCRRISNEVDGNTIVTALTQCISRPTLDDYFRDRSDLLNAEVDSSFGADIKLTDNEELANIIIMQAKEDELQAGFLQPLQFNPARHIFEVLDAIKQSKLFKIIQKMPKGGILHAHDSALCSADYVLSLTYQPFLWQLASSKTNEIEEFRFSRQHPAIANTNESNTNDEHLQWRPVQEVRNEMGAANYDERIRKLFTLFDKSINPRIQFPDINAVWKRFMGLFKIVGSIVTFAPVWKDYYKRALDEMQRDGVDYLEFRGVLPQVFIRHYCIARSIVRMT